MHALAIVSAANAATIGVSLPLGGKNAVLSEQFLIGANLAMKKYGHDHDLMVVDDGCDPELGQLAAQDLIEKHIKIAVGYLCNEPAIIAANMLRSSGVPILIAGARSIRLIKDREREEWNIWRMSPGDDDPALAAAEQLSILWRDKPFAIIDDGTIYGRTFSDVMRAKMEELGAKPAYVDNFRTAQSTQAGLVRRLQRSGVDAAYIAATEVEDIVTIAKNTKELGIPLELASGEALMVLPWLLDADQIEPGVMAIAQPLSANNHDAELLLSGLESQSVDPGATAFAGYASIQIAISVLSKTPEETTYNLQNKQFDTVIGTIRFTNNGKNAINRYVLHRWDGEAFRPLNNTPELEPETQ